MSDAPESEPRPNALPPGLPPRPQPIQAQDDVPPAVIAALVVAGLIGLFFLLKWLVPPAIDWASHQDWHQLIQWLRTIDQPVHDYLATHAAGLPLSAATAYTLWQFIGLGSLALGFLTGATGARLTWTTYGAATVAMVWTQTPATGREVATGLAVLAWTATSTLALRGLSLRPVLVTR
ncbi:MULTISPECIES: hypothetical protein [Bacillati]|uniref:hypothetical protein n=1 Tax=Streptomyces celluloflavus TaxID=58344 RepID=UPI0036DE2F88